jgi:hypothetical protein|tara:strand:- start:1399 stop:1758 length:360 start_codon:yes stop_codon:yes gene_type:complete
MLAATGRKLTKDEMSTNRKGDFAEMYAVTWLWDQGYEAFRNYGSDGPVDIIVWDKKTGEFILVDVKTGGPQLKYKPINGKEGNYTDLTKRRTEEQKQLGVQLLGFNPVTRKCWWVEHRE